MIEITKTIRGQPPRIPFEKMARTVLGRRFELSLVICGDPLAQRMNKKYRPTSPRLRRASKKTYAPNVLSFPLSKTDGEIFLNVRKAAREARRFHVTAREHLAHLFVHGCYHLRGLDHGKKMERLEKRTLVDFGFAANF